MFPYLEELTKGFEHGKGCSNSTRLAQLNQKMSVYFKTVSPTLLAEAFYLAAFFRSLSKAVFTVVPC